MKKINFICATLVTLCCATPLKAQENITIIDGKEYYTMHVTISSLAEQAYYDSIAKRHNCVNLGAVNTAFNKGGFYTENATLRFLVPVEFAKKWNDLVQTKMVAVKETNQRNVIVGSIGVIMLIVVVISIYFATQAFRGNIEIGRSY
ncbi:hypothetical protein FACS189452_10270 [Bacteroidia bacterium]|nr:hypothetical protein FACS189452_10270 [Bacteroidia bacterium]